MWYCKLDTSCPKFPAIFYQIEANYEAKYSNTAIFIKVATSTLHLGHVTLRKLHLGHVTLHLGHGISGASRMKNNPSSCRRTAIRTNVQTDEMTWPTTFRMKKHMFDLAVEVLFRSISIVLHMKLLSHDLNGVVCSMLNVGTFLKMAVNIDADIWWVIGTLSMMTPST